MDYRVAGLSPYDISTYPSPQAKYEPAIVSSGTCTKCNQFAQQVNDLEEKLHLLDVGTKAAMSAKDRVIAGLSTKVEQLETQIANTNMMLNRSIGNQ